MRVLIGCERSGRVRDAFRRLGHDAWSCDTEPSETVGNHLQCDILSVLDDGWDLLIAHPDCTYLAGSAEWAYGDGPYHMNLKPATLVGAARRDARDRAIDFFLRLWNCRIRRVGLENPTVGKVGDRIPKASQRIQPYQFGDDASKGTCLWLRNLPLLHPTLYVLPRIVDGKPRWANQTDGGQNRLSPSATRAMDRARTYHGIANAMADQWGRVQDQSLFSESA